jgi:DNA-binding protein HU-beta
MNKAELIEAIASQVELSKTKILEVIDVLTETVTKTICDGEPVRITGFGTFEPRPRRAKSAINPRTGERIPMGARVVPAFRPGSDLKEAVRRKLKVVESGGELSIVKAVR